MTDETRIPLQDKREESDDWTLTVDQMLFMFKNRDRIETAYENDDMGSLRALESSPEYKSLFQDMSFDEAYDRYESTLEEDSDIP